MSHQSASPVDIGTSSVGARPFRHSLDLSHQYRDSSTEVVTNNMPSSSMQALSQPPKLQTSLSSGDVPTSKGVSNANMGTSNANAHAQQHFHNHNASMGRIPPGAMKRHSRELSADSHAVVTQGGAPYPSISSQLQGGAPAFGPIASSQAAAQSPASAGAGSPSAGSYPYYGGYNQTGPNNNGYGMNMLAMNMQGMGLNNYPSQPYPYNPMYPGAPPQQRDSQPRIMRDRRAQDPDSVNRFANMTLQQARGTIHQLCRDQHGCRYLQKQLENRNPDEVRMIWMETKDHVVELMTDPFGNYLCQKLLEYCTDDERTELIRNATGDMVSIALNPHGTRALQKMIEFVSLPRHVHLITEALRFHVIELIQDLNGNHVIQKCLNKLNSDDAHFIFTAVGNHCIEVGTHRHGCCVLQRCIDHASGDQKMWLVQRITDHAHDLVRDPFGNYVLQYIIDLNETLFTEPLVQQFRGKITELSRHKFSSNVIEKCLRCGNEESKDLMVTELLAPGEMDRLLRDMFGNYVIQTALDHATYLMKVQLVEAIRPILPNVRSTPYGRRLQAKIQQFDARGPNMSGQSTPTDPTQGQISLRQSSNRPMPTQPLITPGNYTSGPGPSGMNGSRGRIAYPSSSNLSVANANPNAPPQPTPRLASYHTYPGTGNPEPQENFF